MKKFSRYLILSILTFLLFNITEVKAFTCNDVDTEINNYKKTNEKINATDCTNLTDSKTAYTCNKLYQEKSQAILNLFQYKIKIGDNASSCNVQISEIDTILKDNEEDCGKVFGDLLTTCTKIFMNLFYILGPILVILFGSLDYTKAVMSNDAERLKKATTAFVKRIVALLLIFLSPAIVNVIIGLNTTNYNLSGDALYCKTKHFVAKKKSSIKDIEVTEDDEDTSTTTTTKKSKKKSSRKGMIAGDYDGYLIRTSKPTMSDTKYYDPSAGNTGQCVWYVKSRAQEILNTVNISASYRKKALNSVKNTYANAKDWWKNSSLSSFGSSNDVNSPKVGAIIVWGSCPGHQYGHVGMVEKVYTNGSGKVTAVDYTEGWTNSGSCPNSNMSCVSFQYNTKKNLSAVKKNSMGEPFLGYIYLLD